MRPCVTFDPRLLLVPFLFLFIIIHETAHAQGLNCELGFNDAYDQRVTQISVHQEFTYVLKMQDGLGGSLQQASLLKIDTNGTVIWETPVAAYFAQHVSISDMWVTAGGTVYTFGYTLNCDVIGQANYHVEKIDADGNIIWTFRYEYESAEADQSIRFLQSRQQDSFKVLVKNTEDSKILVLNESGALTDSLNADFPDQAEFFALNDGQVLSYAADSLSLCTQTGVLVNDKTFTSPILDVATKGDSSWVVTTDSIFVFNAQLELLQQATAPMVGGAVRFKTLNNNARLAYLDSAGAHLFFLDNNLAVNNSVAVPFQVNPGLSHWDFNTNQFTVAENFPLTEEFAIRYQNFAINNSENAKLLSTDIGVVDLRVTDAVLSEHVTSVYDLEVYADVLIKNYGNNVLNSCRINHFSQQGTSCGYGYYGEVFTDLNLQPNDSMWITLGKVHSSRAYYPNVQDSIQKEICVYTSNPNGVTDTVVANDAGCPTISAQVVGITELQKPDKKIKAVYDLMGRPVATHNPGLKIMVYTDGTVKKIVTSP